MAQDESTKYNIGNIEFLSGELIFMLTVFKNKNAVLDIYAHDPRDMRKSGVLCRFDQPIYSRFINLLVETKSKIESLKENVKIEKMSASLLGETDYEINVGSVTTFSGKLDFSIVVDEYKDSYLQIYISNPKDKRISSILLFYNEQKFEELNNMVNETNRSITKLKRSNEMNKLAFHF